MVASAPMLTDAGRFGAPTLVNAGRARATFAQVQPNFGRSRAHVGRLRAKFGRVWPGSAPKSADRPIVYKANAQRLRAACPAAAARLGAGALTDRGSRGAGSFRRSSNATGDKCCGAPAGTASSGREGRRRRGGRERTLRKSGLALVRRAGCTNAAARANPNRRWARSRMRGILGAVGERASTAAPDRARRKGGTRRGGAERAAGGRARAS